jgi:hypothetical protein
MFLLNRSLATECSYLSVGTAIAVVTARLAAAQSGARDKLKVEGAVMLTNSPRAPA